MTEPTVEFVFGRIDNTLKEQLKEFWLVHHDAYQAEINSFRPAGKSSELPKSAHQKALRREPGAIARDENGAIIGIVFTLLRSIDPSLGLGTHAYFVRIYNHPKARSTRLANRLFTTFLNGFEQAVKSRDHRAKFLIAEAITPGLQNPLIRRYLTRHGFYLLGSNKRGSEVWRKVLTTRFVF